MRQWCRLLSYCLWAPNTQLFSVARPGSPSYVSLCPAAPDWGGSCQRALAGSGRHRRGRMCLLPAPVHAAVATGRPGAAAATASASSGDPRAGLGAPTGTPLTFSDVSNSRAVSFPQSLGPSPVGPSSECLGSDHPTASLCPPAPGMGLLPAVILTTSVFPNPCPSDPQYGRTWRHAFSRQGPDGRTWPEL